MNKKNANLISGPLRWTFVLTFVAYFGLLTVAIAGASYTMLTGVALAWPFAAGSVGMAVFVWHQVVAYRVRQIFKEASDE